ncbi:DUF4232 domain-containing protein [Streptomyces sp. NPDC055186]
MRHGDFLHPQRAPGVTRPTRWHSRCTRDRPALFLGRISPGAGNPYAPLVFTHTSPAACHLKGFRSVTLLDVWGERIGDPAQRSGDMRPAVVLAPGVARTRSATRLARRLPRPQNVTPGVHTVTPLSVRSGPSRIHP